MRDTPDHDSLSPAAIAQAAETARALAHPARTRILAFLLTRPGCIGGDIVDEIGLAQSTVSEHLRILRAAGLVVGRIERPRICYSLAPTAFGALRDLIDRVERHATHTCDTCYLPRQGPRHE